MIGYAIIGTNNFEAALKFYDALFSSVGVNRLWKHETMAARGRSRAEPAMCIASPFDEKPASVGNGAMIALRMSDKEAVDTLHANASNLAVRMRDFRVHAGIMVFTESISGIWMATN